MQSSWLLSYYSNMQTWMQMLSILQLHLCPFVQIENIDACLTFLAAKGINTQGLSAEGKLGSCVQLLLVAERQTRPDQSRPVLAASKECYFNLPRTQTSTLNHNIRIYIKPLIQNVRPKTFQQYSLSERSSMPIFNKNSNV